MKKYRLLFLVLCMMLALSACGKENEAANTQATMDALYTAVAQTLAVLTPAVTDTATPTPSPSPTITLIPTASGSKTAVPVVPTSSSSTTCDNAVWAADVTIPDNTVVSPGSSFTKTWSIKNTGTCSWTTSYRIAFVSGSAMSGATTSLTSAVTSGHADNVSVAMVAPTTVGTYTGYWKMQNASGQFFGEPVYVTIKVTSSYTATVTGTITPSATATPNYAATGIYIQTLTAAPTSTPIPTSTTAPATETPTIEPTTETPEPAATT